MSIALYIHVPFCIKKCLYCDFTSYPLEGGAVKNYLASLIKEINLYGTSLAEEDKIITSIFFGGGTPTTLPVASFEMVLAAVRSSFLLTPGCEVTVEANPGTINGAELTGLRELGVNRLSIGVQSFQDRLLQVLGRTHSGDQAVEAMQLARKAGFDNLNLDFIFGIPGQTNYDWQETLQQAVEIAPEHIAAYGLQLEEGTPLEQAVLHGATCPCPEETEADMYQDAIAFLTARGYNHYEISNFAQPGRECAHNLIYWLNQPYLGLGPAAHSLIKGVRSANDISLDGYCDHLSRKEYPIEHSTCLTPADEMSETMFLGLRLTDGVDLNQFYQRFGRRVEDVYGSAIVDLRGKGLLEISRGRLHLTAKGLPLANVVFREFI